MQPQTVLDLSLLEAELCLVPVLKDNYVHVLRDHRENVTAIVDPSVSEPVLAFLEQRGWRLDMILCTHHHADHVGGNLELKEATGCIIAGFEHDAHRIPGIDVRLEEGETVSVGRFQGRVLFIPGHTLGHVAYYFSPLNPLSPLGERVRVRGAKEKFPPPNLPPTGGGILFCGDTLFSMGCGRLFEGTPAQMFTSLKKLYALPDETWVCCGHEYTEANGRFALTLEPDNFDIKERMKEVRALREQDKPTVPVTLKTERATNPFLRPHSREIRETLDMQDASDLAVFTEMRARKDDFS